jgi:hypothetical protein
VSADKYRRFERICVQQSKKIKSLRSHETSVTIYQLTQLNNKGDLNFHDYETLVPKKMGKTSTQHNFYYILEEKSFESVINEITRSIVEELEINLMSLVIFITLNICSTCFEH